MTEEVEERRRRETEDRRRRSFFDSLSLPFIPCLPPPPSSDMLYEIVRE